MDRPSLYRIVALVALVSLVLGACGPKATPTPPPYTPPPPGTVPVVVIQRTPERGQELGIGDAIELVFDRAMDRASVEGALQISPDVRGNYEWQDARTVRFKPARDLKRATEYLVTLGAEATGSDGNPIDGAYRFRFRTVGFLEVAQVIPADGTQDVEAGSTVTVIFNRPVVPLTAVSDPAFAGLPQPVSFDPPIEGVGEWLNTSIYVFTPADPLAGGTTFTARIAAGLADTTGGVLDEDYAWSFSTQPPQIVWVSPREEAEQIAIDTTVEVTFNMPVDGNSAAEAFSLKRGTEPIPGSVEVNGASLVFTPDEALDFDTIYTARLDAGVHSARGGEGMREAYAWQFTTVPLPQILATNPRDGQNNAWPYTAFEIVFNTRIDAGTVMPNLTMIPPLSPSQVFTYFNTWDHTFVLEFGAQPSSEYEVVIGPDIADPYGNTTGQEMTVRFRTAPLTPWANVNVPGLIGTLDANQPARLVVRTLNTNRIDLSLYRLDLDEFFRAHREWWDFEIGRAPFRQWSVPVEAPLNKTQRTPVDLAQGRGNLAPGIYLVELSAPEVEFDRWSHRRLLIVSEYNVTVKTGQEETWAWVTELATGQPAPGVALIAQENDGTLLKTANTDDAGVARFDIGARVSSAALFVASDDPFILSGTDWDWTAGISPWDFGLDVEHADRDRRAHIYTDRPIYRPGQVVYFRGVLRAEDDVQYSLPRTRTVNVSVYDAVGEEIYAAEMTLDDFGTLHGELTLSDGASLGQYTIQASIGDDNFQGGFQVAAYRPPEFEVLVTPRSTELADGQSSEADVEVRYFFGGPVASVPVEWHVLSAPYRFEPDQFGRYSFSDDESPWICRWCWWWEPPEPNVVLSGSGTTDAQGRLTIPLPSEVMTGAQRLTVEASASGRDGQTISGRSDVVVHPGEFYVGLAPQQVVGEAGEELAIDVVSVDWDGERLAEQSFEVNISRREWINTFIEDGFGGRWQWDTLDTPVFTGTLTTDENGDGVITFTPEKGGSYRVVASGRDRRERLVRSSTWVWVSGAEYVSWRRENNDRITLVSNKSSYVPGETAEILIPSPFSGEQWAWITVERGGVLEQEVLQMESNSTVYRLPITPGHAPNVYVSVVIVKGPDETEPVATHKVGYVLLTVEPVVQELAISLTPSVEQAGPGDRVSFDVRATDVSGEPVRAAFSLDLVDKAVLSLQPRPPNAILNAFYGQRGLGVLTASGLSISVNRLLQEELEELDEEVIAPMRDLGGADEAEMMEAPAAAPVEESVAAEGEMRSAAKQLPPGVDLREEFADTAFWDATVVTDQAGRASVSIPLPDNLTTWVFRGVGATAETQVGEATVELLVTKPLLIRPVTPRFFVVDDRVQLAALVSNNSGTTQEVEVSLHAEGLVLEDEATQTVTIADGAETKVTWWVTVEDVPAVDVAMSSLAGPYSDAARPRLTTGPEGTLLVHRYTAPEIVGTGGQLVGEDARTEVVALPPKYDDRRGTLKVRLDPSLAAGMTDGLDYLEHFPYECAEQTVSRFLPNVLTYQALRRLEIRDEELEAKLPGLVAEGLGKLYVQQQDDGGWGWWPEGESNPYLSAYVVFALVKAQEAGFEVKQATIERGLDFLEGALVSERELQSHREANRQVFILYVMSEAGRARRASKYAEGLFQRRDKLSHYGRAFLALTLDLAYDSDSRINTLLSDLQNAAILSATGAHWEEAAYDWWAMNTDTRSTAIILDALARLDPENALIPQAVRWLMVARKDGIWETTQETAWALIAFTDWMIVTGELKGAYEFGVELNDRMLAQGSVTQDTVDEPVEVEVDVADLIADVGNRLTIGRGPGEGRLYYTAHLQVYLPVEEIEPLNRGIIVSRQYCRQAADAQDEEGSGRCAEVDEVSVGDVVDVRLTVIAPHDLYYVAVEDPLPAGAEAIDPSLATTSQLEQEPGLYRSADEEWYPFYYRWWRWYSRSELRDDRVVLFADYLPAGTYEYIYSFRATQPGQYQVIPTSAYEFYFPEVFGRGDGRLFTITE